MGLFATKPIREIHAEELRALIGEKHIGLFAHVLDHVDSAQRKVFKEQDLIRNVGKETPRKAYLQQNGRYCAYYRTNDGYRKIILHIEPRRVMLVTFMDVSELPKTPFEQHD